MTKKIGPNEPCWCGSNKKFKKCHRDREFAAPMQPWEASKAMRKAFSVKTCLAPDTWRTKCTGQIVQAHTISKGSGLSAIARKGHVYSFGLDFDSIQRFDGIPVPVLTGINQASTFTGFCSEHDNSIFAPIEKKTFTGTPEQCFLLHYRAFSKEAFIKRAVVSLKEQMRTGDRGKSPQDQIEFQEMQHLHGIGTSASVKDNESRKDTLDKMLVAGDFGAVRAYLIELDTPVPIMVSTGFSPEEDFEGKMLQDIGDLSRVPDLISVNSFASAGRGFIVFTWLAPEEACSNFVQSLDRISNSVLTDALLRLFFEMCENSHIQPDWWDSLNTDSKARLLARFAQSGNPFTARPEGHLKDDGLHFDPWAIKEKRFVGAGYN